MARRTEGREVSSVSPAPRGAPGRTSSVRMRLLTLAGSIDVGRFCACGEGSRKRDGMDDKSTFVYRHSAGRQGSRRWEWHDRVHAPHCPVLSMRWPRSSTRHGGRTPRTRRVPRARNVFAAPPRWAPKRALARSCAMGRLSWTSCATRPTRPSGGIDRDLRVYLVNGPPSLNQ